MLRFPNGFVDEPKANKMIADFMNQRVVKMLSDILVSYCRECGAKKIEPDDMMFASYISYFFPPNYSEAAMYPIFFGLLELLQSEEAQVPTLVMEYVMNSIIEDYIDCHDEKGDGSITLIPERDYILQTIRENMSDELEEMEISPEEYLGSFEDMHDYMDWYFWDVDFALLNDYTEEEIAESDANKQCGIMGKEYKRTFVVPTEWMK